MRGPMAAGEGQAQQIERRRQVRGLVWLALAALGLAIGRAVAHGGVRSLFGRS